MHHYIAIEGVIGVGKTSLARYLQEVFEANLLLEVFEENPFLARFYEDRSRYAFQTQVFFLLSRYDQQRRIHQMPRPLVSDYIFAKDRLFARQNLSGDELTIYERVYEALNPNIPRPQLVVYLRADTNVLMAQIARRDRPYERNMDVTYIDQLRVAYDHYFAEYDEAPVLTIDTSSLDFVQSQTDRDWIINKIRGALGIGPQQTALPGLNGLVSTSVEPEVIPTPLDLSATAKRLADFQGFHREFDKLKGFNTDLFLNFVLLQEEVGELAKAMVGWWQNPPTASESDLANEFADVLAYIFKLANYTNVDLEAAYLAKMHHNLQRTWNKGNKNG